MENMQAFHDTLFADAHGDDDYLACLAQLAAAEPERLSVLDQGRSWDSWSTKTA